MENNEIKMLITSFKEYRELLTPIEENLKEFSLSFESIESDLKNLSSTFDGTIQEKLDKIYKELSMQADKTKTLSAQVDNYKRRTELYSTVELNVAGNVQNPEDESEEYYMICQEAALGDEELESYVKAIHRCNTFDEVCSEMGISNKKYIYNLQRKLKRRIISLSKK